MNERGNELKVEEKERLRKRRHRRVRGKVNGTAERPRLNVSRSIQHIYAQLVDDVSGNTITAASTLTGSLKEKTGGNVDAAKAVGKLIAEKALEKTFGKKPIPMRGGGSIPIVAMFKKELQRDSILMGFGLDSDAIHSPNEHFGIFNFLKGIETIPYFYQYLAEMS